MKRKGRVFICYRREGGAEMARLVRDSLRERGLAVFMDVEDLKSGQFNEALLREIEAATDVVAILTPGSLDRCLLVGDWLRWEIGHAISCEKNIVPILTKGFSWPTQPLPEDLQRLPYYQAVEPSHNFFDASMDKLVTLLSARSNSISPRVRKVSIAICSLLLLFMLTWHLSRRTGQTPDQNEVLGRELCFQRDSWQQGATLLAASDSLFKPAAVAELAFSNQGNEAALARLWAAAGTAVPPPDKWHCYRRARYWFKAALENPVDRESALAIANELARLPTLKARLRLKGESYFKERIAIGPAAMRWVSESGAGPYEIIGMKTNVQPFTFEYGKPNSCIFRTTDFLPEGLDFTTARVGSSRFGGKTGQHASQKLELGPDKRGVVLRVEEEDPHGAGHQGSFTFDIVIFFGGEGN